MTRSPFALVERRGKTERELAEAETLEEIRDFLEDKTGANGRTDLDELLPDEEVFFDP